MINKGEKHMDEIKEFVLDYIQREYSLPNDVDAMEFNYIDSGYVDSMGFIQFIATLEDEFNISFSDEDMENPDIKVIGKLIEMIKAKRNA